MSTQGSELGVEKWSCVFGEIPTDNSNTHIGSGLALETGSGSMLFLTRPLGVDNDAI